MSVVSAQYVMEAARDRFDVVPIGVTKEGAWLTPEETQLQLDREDVKFHKTLELEGERGILARPDVLASLGEIDVAFPLIPGTFAEDGPRQGPLGRAGSGRRSCGGRGRRKPGRRRRGYRPAGCDR